MAVATQAPDPEFLSLSPEARRLVLQRVDPEFAKLSPEAQNVVLSRMGKDEKGIRTPEPPDARQKLHGHVELPITAARDVAEGTKRLLSGPMPKGVEFRAAPNFLSLKWFAEKLREVDHAIFVKGGQYAKIGEHALIEAIPSIGGMAGGAGGFMVGGPPGAVGGAGIGGMGGEAARQLIHRARYGEEVDPMTSQQAATRIATAGVVEGAAQATGEALALPLRHLSRTSLRTALTGTGDRFIEQTAKKALKKQADVVGEVTEGNVKAVGKYADEVAAAERANAIATSKFEGRTAQIEAREARLNAAIAARNEADLAEHAATVTRIQELNRAAEEAVTRRAALSERVLAEGDAIGRDVKALEQQVRAVGNSKYEAVHAAVAGDVIPASELVPAVQQAERNILRGSPENIKQFRDILSKGSVASEVESSVGTLRPGDSLYEKLMAAGALEEPVEFGFRDLQGYYSELGDKMAGGNLPGDVYYALKHVHDALGQQMNKMAGRHGALEQLAEAKGFWRKYREVFHDMRPVSQGGSPVARTQRAVDSHYATAPLLGPAGERAAKLLGHYDKVLAKRVGQLRGDYTTMKGLPQKFKPKDVPGAPKLRGTARLTRPEAPTLKDIPGRPELEPMPGAPDLAGAVRAAREERLNALVIRMRSISGWDVASLSGGFYQLGRGDVPIAFGVTILRRGMGALLDNPGVAKWLTNVTPHDLTILAQFGPDEAAVKSGLAKLYRTYDIAPPRHMKDYLGNLIAAPIRVGKTALAAGHEHEPTSEQGILTPSDAPPRRTLATKELERLGVTAVGDRGMLEREVSTFINSPRYRDWDDEDRKRELQQLVNRITKRRPPRP